MVKGEDYSWETEFVKVRTAGSRQEMRGEPIQVYAMYREYRVLKAELEKENAGADARGQFSAPDPADADIGPQGRRVERAEAISRRPAADSSDDEDDEEVVEATPVKKAAIRSPPFVAA